MKLSHLVKKLVSKTGGRYPELASYCFLPDSKCLATDSVSMAVFDGWGGFDLDAGAPMASAEVQAISADLLSRNNSKTRVRVQLDISRLRALVELLDRLPSPSGIFELSIDTENNLAPIFLESQERLATGLLCPIKMA